MPRTTRPPVKQSTYRLTPETVRQVHELSRIWGESQAGVITRSIERAYQQERTRMNTLYILTIGDREYQFRSLSDMAAKANEDPDSGQTLRYYAEENGERRPLTDEEYAELEA